MAATFAEKFTTFEPTPGAFLGNAVGRFHSILPCAMAGLASAPAAVTPTPEARKVLRFMIGILLPVEKSKNPSRRKPVSAAMWQAPERQSADPAPAIAAPQRGQPPYRYRPW